MTEKEFKELVIGGEDLAIRVGSDTVPLARPLSFVFVGAGGVVLVWVAMGLIVAGAKVIAITLGDAEAVKRVLKHAFGKTREITRSVPARGARRPGLDQAEDDGI